MSDKKFELYEHHGRNVWVESSLKGKHRDNCLCYSCALLDTENRDNNCKIANILYALCCAEDIVTPVYECPKFIKISHLF